MKKLHQVVLPTFLEQPSTKCHLRTDGIKDCVVADNILDDTDFVHFLKELQALFPKVTPGTCRNSGVVNVYIWGNTLHFHSVHQLKRNVCPTTFLHARHCRTKNDDILLDTGDNVSYPLPLLKTAKDLTLTLSFHRGTQDIDDTAGLSHKQKLQNLTMMKQSR